MATTAPLNVLVVDNDWLIRMSATEMLDDLGHEGTAVPTAEAALRLLKGGCDIDLMLLDVGLPDMDGRQLAALALGLRPSLRIVFASGYGPERIGEAASHLNAAYLAKPYLLDDLRRAMNGHDQRSS